MNNKMLSVVAIAALAGVASAQVPYSNNFNAGPVGAEWSATSTDTSPSLERFLGQFGNGNVTLNLGVQPAGSYTIDFDFYAIRSLDGNGPAGGGPDNFEFIGDASTLLYTNFDNYGNGNTQAYPSATNFGTFAGGTGAAAINSLGYTFGGAQFGDSTYHLSLTVLHAGGVLTFGFNSYQNQGTDDESWGLDNVSVVPVPGAAGLALVGFGALGRRRTR